MQRPLIIGTRGSALALAQAHAARAAFARALGVPESDRDEALPITAVRTTGDRNLKGRLADVGGKGLFTKEIEEALIDGRVDIAVHSLKDVPAHETPGLVLAAVLERADPRDAFISVHWGGIDDLPGGAIVGTASARREAQALHRRPDLRVEVLRGSVETRLGKVVDGTFDATFLAMAGLIRLDCADAARRPLTPEEMLPAACQGLIALQARADDADARALCAKAEHGPSAIQAAAERAFLVALDGSCRTPLAALSERTENTLRLRGEAFTLDGVQRWTRDETIALGADPRADAAALGARLGEAIGAEAGDALGLVS